MKIRILIVDDEKEFVDSLAERLSMRDYDVTTSLSGEEAIEKVKGYNFDESYWMLPCQGWTASQRFVKSKG